MRYNQLHALSLTPDRHKAHMSIKFLLSAITAAALNFSCTQVLADISGARLRLNSVDLQFDLVTDQPSREVFDFMFGTRGVVPRLANVLSRQSPEQSAQPKDLTVEIVKMNDAIVARFASGTIGAVDTSYPGGEFRPQDREALVQEVCKLLALQECVDPNLPERAPRAGEGRAPRDSRGAASTVEITIGALPNASRLDQLLVSPPSRQPRGARTRATPLSDAIRGRAERAFSPRPPAAERRRTNETTKRTHFVVHCTAFAASDQRMRQWVENRKAEGARNKSHGVILPSGEYLPIWPYSERRVWATKTETCAETANRALGNLINIELHYFCASNRNDQATAAQYGMLADIFKKVNQDYGPLTIVSHREVDRGLHDGHNDPVGFSFDQFYTALQSKGVDVAGVRKISDTRHGLRTGRDISHHSPPMFSGGLVLERTRPDDCKRDSRAP